MENSDGIANARIQVGNCGETLTIRDYEARFCQVHYQGIYADRVVGGYCHHCHFSKLTPACVGQGEREGAKDLVHKQLEADRSGIPHLGK